jgi:small subunit ribosomal protein S20
VANTKSAIKRMKQNEKRRQRNRAVRSSIRTAVKSARSALAAKQPEARTVVLEAMRTLDRAVGAGVMHPNTVARRKSSLARQLNSLG